MKVRTFVGAQYAYALLHEGNRTMDVQLFAGHSVKTSLTMSVLELREQAEKLTARADLIEQAIPLF